jgi:cytochrome c oxidase subunit II
MATNWSSKAFAGLVIALATAACTQRVPEQGIARGEELFDTCAPCHGPAGAGNQELGAPAIAGLPQWYLENQLNSFKNDWRGANPFDTVGIRMKSMVLALDLEGDLESVAEFVASMPATEGDDYFPAGDVSAGQATYSTGCIACHGPTGDGNPAIAAPPLAGQSDWYLFGQLRKFKAGWRGAHPDDTPGRTMVLSSGVANMDNADMINIVSYIETLR